MAPLTGDQLRVTTASLSVAPLAGARSCGASVGQFCARGMVKRAWAERTPGHPSSTASTNQRYEPEGSARVIEVTSSVSAICTNSALLSETKSRESSVSGTALQTKATGEVT